MIWYAEDMKLVSIRKDIREHRYDLSEHAHRERQEEAITVLEIEQVIAKGVIIEKYIHDFRGESCLISGKISDHPLHVVCGMRGKRLLIVTVYRPRLHIWTDEKTRAKEVKSRV